MSKNDDRHHAGVPGAAPGRGRDPDFALDSASDSRLDAYLDALNPMQRQAVLHAGGPLLILAGAGSGKTRVITTKIAYLIGSLGVDPRAILAVTFTNKAANEMYSRVLAMSPGAAGVLIRTFHSFGAWLLRRNATLMGLSPRFSIYDDDDSVTLLGSINEGSKRRSLIPYARWISRAKDYCLGPDDDLSEISLDLKLPEIYRAYRQKLRKMGNADFGDLIMRSVELLKQNPEVRSRLRSRFRYILVDEYQDSNVAQFELLRALAGPETYLCVVGDDDQSIYRFRGAEVRNILTFEESFPGTTIIRLEQNYRSTGNILAIASDVVRNNEGRLGKTLWTEQEEGPKAVVALLEDERAEAEYCARLLADGNLAGTAILYRTNAQSRSFETYFTRAGIAYRLVGALRFYDREEIKDILAVLSLLANPADEVAFRRVINKPTRGIGPKGLSQVLRAASDNGWDLLTAAKEARAFLQSKARGGAEEFSRYMQDCAEKLESLPLPEFIKHVIEVSGLGEYYRRQDEAESTKKEENLEQVVDAAADYPSGMDGITRFLEDLELDRARTEEQDEDIERVTLITMHNTKGLEFDRVIITGLEECLFPGRNGDDDEAVEEERRIFYVALTRAKRELYLTHCRVRFLWGRREWSDPSRFLEEIPRDLVCSDGAPVGESDREGGDLPVGTCVYNDDYGTGVVCKEWYNGKDYMVLVRFETGRTATFIPKYTPLEKVMV